MTTVTLEDAQAHLPEILDRLRPGEAITIVDRGEPTAQVTKTASASSPGLRPPPGLGRGMITIVADDDSHLDDFAEYLP